MQDTITTASVYACIDLCLLAEMKASDILGSSSFAKTQKNTFLPFSFAMH